MIRLCSRACPSLLFGRTAPVISQRMIDQRTVPFSVVQKRFYCPDAKLHEQVAYDRYGFRGLDEEEQRNALKVLHNFVMKRMGQQDYEDVFNAMRTMAELTHYSSSYAPVSGLNLQNYDFYKNNPSELQKLYEIFADSGMKLLRSKDFQKALPLLRQAFTLIVPIKEWEFKAIFIRNAVEIARICREYRNDCSARAQAFKVLREQAEESNLPKDQIASLLRNEAACVAFTLCFKSNTEDFNALLAHFGTQLYKRASSLDPHEDDGISIQILESLKSKTYLGFSTEAHFVWKEGSLPYIDLPRMVFVF